MQESRGEGFPLGGAPGRVANDAGGPAHQGNDAMPRMLGVQQGNDGQQVAHVQGGGGRVKPGIQDTPSPRQMGPKPGTAWGVRGGVGA